MKFVKITNPGSVENNTCDDHLIIPVSQIEAICPDTREVYLVNHPLTNKGKDLQKWVISAADLAKLMRE